MGGTFGLEARERGAPATARGPPSLSSRSSLRVAKQAAAGSGRRLLDALLQAPLKLRKQAGKRFSTWLGMYWVLQGQNSGARGGGGAKPALTRARGEKRKISRVWGTSVGHLRNTAILLFVSTPQGFQEKCFEFLGVVLRNSIDKFRFEIQEESVGSAPGGGAGLSRAYARAEQRFIDPHPRGPGSRSDQFIRLRGPVTGSQKPSSL